MPPQQTATTGSAEAAAPNEATPGKTDSYGFYDPAEGVWQSLNELTDGLDAESAEAERKRAKRSREALNGFLLSSLQMQHLTVLAGSGTSLGPVVNGPSMRDLWKHCVLQNPEEQDEHKWARSDAAESVIKAVNFDSAVTADERNQDNIEALLSRCEAFLQVNVDTDTTVKEFVKAAKGTILDKCRHFLNTDAEDQLQAHRTFLHRLSRRRVRDSRLKLFTTNYDLCFETAAGKQGLISLDGFSFTQPRFFDPRFYSYDIVRRSPSADDFGTPLEGVFVLYKLHGSVTWERTDNAIVATDKATADNVCMIFPATGKYQQSYIQPHLELMSQYLSSLREPNTCLISIGYGFNDDHLSEPILAAVRSNPHLRLIVVSPTTKQDVENNDHRYWKPLFDLAKAGHDIRLINATFEQFAKIIPDLRSLTPAEQLSKDIQRIAASS